MTLRAYLKLTYDAWLNMGTANAVLYPIGRVIKAVRWMTDEEATEEGWYDFENIPVIVLDDDSIIYPSADDEGNRGGVLFGRTKDGDPFYLNRR